MKDELDRYIAANQERYLAELRELCAIASEAADPAALERAAAWCRDRLVAAGCTTREIRADSIPTLVVGEAGRGARTLVCVQHYDVQPAVPLELWQSPPYDPAIRDGAVYARGVEDNKGHLVLRIQAIEAHQAVFGELPIRVRFLIEGEEESGSGNLHRLLEQDPAILEADGALKEGGSLDAVGRPQLFLGNKGILYVELCARTIWKDAHSAHGNYLPNAAWRLMRALATLRDEAGRIQIAGFYDQVREPTAEERRLVASMPFEAERIRGVYRIDRFAFGLTDTGAREAWIFQPTCNVCGVWSGYTGAGSKTVIPAEARAKLDFRLVPDQDPETIAGLLRRHLDTHGFADVEMVSHQGERPYRGPIDSPLVRTAQAVAQEAFDKAPVIFPNGAGTAPMWLISHRHKLANVTLGMGTPDSGAHAPNEHISLGDYWRALRATARLYRLFATQK